MHGEITRKEKITAFSVGVLVGLVILGAALSQLPAVQRSIGWRVDFAMTFLRGVVDPVKPMPTAASVAQAVDGASSDGENLPVPVLAEHTPQPSATPSPQPTMETPVTPEPTFTLAPTLTPTAIPEKVELKPPSYEEQDLNNCGPATLSMHLRYYDWQGDQKTISDLIKPKREDRNVNVEELAAYVHTKVPGIEIIYRVGGDIDILKRLIAAGFPVTIEEGFTMAESYWMNDDRWAGHYLLLTGYDDAVQRFTVQDVFVGPNISMPYSVVDENWQAFNRVYVVVYPVEQREQVKSILGEHWDADFNRQHALEAAKSAAEADSTDSYAWFNYGTNLVYFERYAQAAHAYDQARNAGLPQRMLRYQFGPFFAYFHTNRIEDLLALTEYALKRTPNSEEALLWRGWGMYRQGNREESLKAFQEALAARPEFPDAIYGLNFLRDN